MECDCSSHPTYKKIIIKGHQDYSSRSTMQLRCSSRGIRRAIYAKFRNYSTAALEVLEELRLLGYKEFGGLSDPGPRDT
jgi:hypothetical protein